MNGLLCRSVQRTRIHLVRRAVHRVPASESGTDLEGILRNVRRQNKEKSKPDSHSFYTSRASYYDNLFELEEAVKTVRSTLSAIHLLPLPAFAKASLPQIPTVWCRKDEMTTVFDAPLTTARYRKVLALLTQLNEYRKIATVAGIEELRSCVNDIIELFESDKKDAVLTRGVTKPVKIDEYGRSYTVGRRKTSTARVWLIRTPTRRERPLPPVQPASGADPPAPTAAVEAAPAPPPAGAIPPSPPPADATWIKDAITDLPSSLPTLDNDAHAELTPPPPPPPPPQQQHPHIPITPSEILVNNAPLSSYFALPADRERVVRPFTVAGLLGAYNVFALVRGGGMSGQSGAVALGIAKGLVAQERAWSREGEGAQVEKVLRRAKLLRRDPRMVERKKTGFAKARKKYAWVKR